MSEYPPSPFPVPIFLGPEELPEYATKLVVSESKKHVSPNNAQYSHCEFDSHAQEHVVGVLLGMLNYELVYRNSK